MSRSLVLSVLTAAPLSLTAQAAGNNLDLVMTHACEEDVGGVLRLWVEEDGDIWSPDLDRFIGSTTEDLKPSEHPSYEVGSAPDLTLSFAFRSGATGMDVLIYDHKLEDWAYYDTVVVERNYGRISLPIDSSFKLELTEGGISEELIEYPYEDGGTASLPPQDKAAVLKPVKDCND
ncbi:hypothetical protein [Enhygromyxa salina]|nr:hypothetical protein [Enhygromyxa salina]